MRATTPISVEKRDALNREVTDLVATLRGEYFEVDATAEIILLRAGSPRRIMTFTAAAGLLESFGIAEALKAIIDAACNRKPGCVVVGVLVGESKTIAELWLVTTFLKCHSLESARA